MNIVNGIFNYLVGYLYIGLMYQTNGSQLVEGWVNSDQGGDNDTSKSITRWIFKLARSAISWASQRQKTITISSTEAKYIATSNAAKEAIWLLGFYNEIRKQANLEPQKGINLHMDNISAIKLTKNAEFYKRTKHINIRHYYIRECIKNGQIVL